VRRRLGTHLRGQHRDAGQSRLGGRIDLAKTRLAGRPFEALQIERSSDDWLRCSVDADVFKGCGGPANLHEVLDVFAGWAKAEVEPLRDAGATVPPAE
jgi:hypothetical protein